METGTEIRYYIYYYQYFYYYNYNYSYFSSSYYYYNGYRVSFLAVKRPRLKKASSHGR